MSRKSEHRFWNSASVRNRHHELVVQVQWPSQRFSIDLSESTRLVGAVKPMVWAAKHSIWPICRERCLTVDTTLLLYNTKSTNRREICSFDRTWLHERWRANKADYFDLNYRVVYIHSCRLEHHDSTSKTRKWITGQPIRLSLFAGSANYSIFSYPVITY